MQIFRHLIHVVCQVLHEPDQLSDLWEIQLQQVTVENHRTEQQRLLSDSEDFHFLTDTKGGKLRRLYIPKKLRTETLSWLEESHRSSGYLFLNRFGERITTRGISQQLKNYAKKYGLDKKVVYPHSFRHRYAKNFLEKYNDIALLADLMGHESIETTRIYLRRTASEQKAIVDKIVTW